MLKQTSILELSYMVTRKHTLESNQVAWLTSNENNVC